MTPAQLAEADALWDEAKARDPRDDLYAALMKEPDEEREERYWWLRD